jgi:ABC-2 type transport system ATP-binding protein
VIPSLTLAIEPGVTGLLGPSGCGKTTLMRAIVGVQQTAGGRVEVLGERASSTSLRERVAYVTQAPSVYGDLTVSENLRFFAKVLNAPVASVTMAIDLVDLGDCAHKIVNELSGGQRSRVSLAVALLKEPKVLILDEPTVGLDPVLRRDLWRLFHQLADRGQVVLVSSHVMDEAERCDRLLLMRSGRIVADSTPQTIKETTGTHDIESAFLKIVEDAS